MLYQAYEFQRALLSGASAWAAAGAEFLNNPSNPWGYNGAAPMMASALKVFAHTYAPHGKPEWRMAQILREGREYPARWALMPRCHCVAIRLASPRFNFAGGRTWRLSMARAATTR